MKARKTETTQEYVESMFDEVISVGYCKLQFLLHFIEPKWYTTREEGWAADVYDLGDTAVVTGYETFGKEADKEKCRAFDEEAHRIIQESNPTTDVAWRKVSALLEQFLDNGKAPDIAKEYLDKADRFYEEYLADDAAAGQMSNDACADMRSYEQFCLARELTVVENEYPFIAAVLKKAL